MMPYQSPFQESSLGFKLRTLIDEYGREAFQQAVIAYFQNVVARENRCLIDGHDLSFNPCHHCRNERCVLAGKKIPWRVS